MEITAVPLEIPDAILLRPGVIDDERGYLFEAWNDAAFRSVVGDFGPFVQDNQSRSGLGVLRGLHYQLPNPQGKLVRVIVGRVFSVGVDIRLGSDTFGGWVGVLLTAEDRNQLWLPPGFAHGLLALDEGTEVIYKVTAYFAPGCDHSIRWDDPDIGINWPLLDFPPILSAKDRDAALLADAVVYD